MLPHLRALISPIHQYFVLLFLLIATMIAARIWYTGTQQYIFLIWNLFLAWIPFVCSEIAQRFMHRRSWKMGSILLVWILFFPNALYLVTDLMHLADNNTSAPVWFDVVLLFVTALTGLMLAFVSLYQIEIWMKQQFRFHRAHVMSWMAIALGSFGVYLGRFLRWNSWDVVTDPLELMKSIVGPLITPLQHERAWVVTAMLTCIFICLYQGIKKLPDLLKIGQIKLQEQTV